jgi:hypothetical protein
MGKSWSLFIDSTGWPVLRLFAHEAILDGDHVVGERHLVEEVAEPAPEGVVLVLVVDDLQDSFLSGSTALAGSAAETRMGPGVSLGREIGMITRRSATSRNRRR